MTVQLAEIVRRTGLDRTLAVGEMILNRFFGGQADEWRVRRKNKKNSVRRLADRPGCPLSRSALNQATGVYVAVKALPCVRTFGHIDSSHVAVVLRLGRADQERWLRLADRERWSVRRLRAEITDERRSAGERRGRPSVSELERLLSAVKGAARAVESAVTSLTDSPDLTPLRTLVSRLQRLEMQLVCLHGQPRPRNETGERDQRRDADLAEPAADQTPDQFAARLR